MAGTQKMLLKDADMESYKYIEGPIPEPGPGEVLIKVERVAICGSDIALYKWNDVGRAIAKLPFTPGHETSGTVFKCGPGVDSLTLGTRVAVENHFYCGTCYQCTHDQKHICQRMNQYGHGKGSPHGGCSQYSIVPAAYLYPLETDINMDYACLLEPCGVAHHAVEEVGVQDDTVLILGCGPIGLMAIPIAKAMGAAKIIVSDVLDSKLAIAREMGADVTINPKTEDLKAKVLEHTNGDGAGALIECSGVMSNTCFPLLRKGGRVLLLGLPKGPLHVENVLQDFLFRSITLKTIHGRKIFHTWKETEHMIASGAINVQPVITEVVPMSRFEDAFASLLAGTACKILMDPWA